MKRVAVIGAGLHGISAASAFIRAGHNVTVIEARDDIGGVWHPDCNYPGVIAQNPRDAYFLTSAGRIPPEYGATEWPRGEQVYAHLRSVAAQEGLMDGKRLRLNTRVLAARPLYGDAGSSASGAAGGDSASREACSSQQPSGPPTGWRLVLQGTGGAANGQLHHQQPQEEEMEVDVLIVCTGCFNVPSMPPLEGREAFEAAGGKVLHTSALGGHGGGRLQELAAGGKRVVVVGNGRSGVDVANHLAQLGAKVELLYRYDKWTIPMYLFGLNMKYPLTSRAGCWFMRRLHPIGGLLGVFHRLAGWMQWRQVELMIRTQLGLDKLGHTPKVPIERSIVNSYILAEPPGFWSRVHRGLIRMHRADVACLQPGGATLTDGTQLQADAVICATGYSRSLPFLPPEVYHQLVQPDGTLQLYHMLYPYELGGTSLFVLGWGYSILTTPTCEVAARWILEAVEGRMKLPSHEQMAAFQQRLWSWIDGTIATKEGRRDARGGCTAPYTFEHLDDMLLELGAGTRSLSWLEWVQYYMGPMNPLLCRKMLDALPTGKKQA